MFILYFILIALVVYMISFKNCVDSDKMEKTVPKVGLALALAFVIPLLFAFIFK